ncbi:MAG: tRNA (adenosine(37)-N6)-dimethylallyltransferase MiaA [Devosia sp.]
MTGGSAGRVVLIAGPTASGKSALALKLALRSGALIVNADAMQVYDTLRVVTARPSDGEMDQVPHLLYGTVPVSTRFSTGRWLEAVRGVMADEAGRRPLIFVGGTGLYFDALQNGFADVPEIPAEIVLQVQQEIQEMDAERRMQMLRSADPAAAGRLKVADPQRVIRAVAVKRATGQTLSSFQDTPQTGLLANSVVERIILDPDRDLLRERIAHRFQAMFSNGAVDEVRALLAQQLDPALPAMKAIGVPEIAAWLDGRMTREEAIDLATIATHQYAKRQRTWFRNRMGDWPRRDPLKL